MATLHVSEGEAVQDFAALLERVRQGVEVIIESADSPIALLSPLNGGDRIADAAEHDIWFRAQVLEALDDESGDIPGEDVEAHFAARRAASRTESHRAVPGVTE